jgi:hypothetical protein
MRGLGESMKKTVAAGPNKVLGAVQGSGASEGLIEVLPKVVSDMAAQKRFFTQQNSKIVMNEFRYFIEVELAFLTLWTNYEEVIHKPASYVKTVVTDFRSQVMNQLNSFKPLPTGTVVDMKTGLMWTTDNGCIRSSLQPPSCSSEVGGFPITTACDVLGPGCSIPVPFPGPNADFVASAMASGVQAGGGWSVPSRGILEGLLNERASGSAGAWLTNAGGIKVNGEFVWTADIGCINNPLRLEFNRNYQVVAAWCDGVHRVVLNITNAKFSFSKWNACNGRPCSAAYMLYRPVSLSNPWGVLKRW